MEIADILLNLLGLGLWASAAIAPRSQDQDPAADSAARRILLGCLLLLLALRALLFWILWPDRDLEIDLGAVDYYTTGKGFTSHLVHSLCSFLAFLFLFHLWVLGLRLALGRVPGVARATGRVLGPAGRWPPLAGLALSLLGGMALWIACWGIGRAAGLELQYESLARHCLRAPLVALSLWTTFAALIQILLLLHLILSYVHLGDHPFLAMVDRGAEAFLRPLRLLPLRIARIDTAPLLGVVLYGMAGLFAQKLILQWM